MVQVSPDWLGNCEGGKTGAEIGRCLLHRIPGVPCNRNLLGLVHRKPLASPGVKDTATAMGTAPGAGYFQRGSLFWLTIITVSFTYYTVMPASGRHGSRSRTGLPEQSLGNRLARLSLRGRGWEAGLAPQPGV